jgi:hypothetical protein
MVTVTTTTVTPDSPSTSQEIFPLPPSTSQEMLQALIQRIMKSTDLEIVDKLKVINSLLSPVKDDDASVLGHLKHLVQDKELDNNTKFLVIKDLVTFEESTSPPSPVTSSPAPVLKRKMPVIVIDDSSSPEKRRRLDSSSSEEASDSDSGKLENIEWNCTCQTCGSEFKQFNGEYRTLYRHREQCLAVPLDRKVIKDDLEKKSFRGGLNSKKNKELMSTFFVKQGTKRCVKSKIM